MTKPKKGLRIAGVALLALAFAFGFSPFASATTTNMTGDALQPASAETITGNLTVSGTGYFDSIYIGYPGVGGVTFFNGTIVNITNDADGNPNPVTIGDDLRVDGTISRGYGDVKIDDSVRLTGNLYPTADGLYTLGNSKNYWKNLYTDNAKITNLSISENLAFVGTLTGPDANLTGTLTVGGLTTLNGGITADGGKFTVADTSGNIHTDGTLDVDGNTNLDGSLQVDGTVNIDGVLTTHNILPDGDGLYNLGSSSNEWKDAWLDYVYTYALYDKLDTNYLLKPSATSYLNNLNLAGNLSVDGATAIDTLGVAGVADFKDYILSSTGNVWINDSFRVTGTTEFVNDVDFGGNDVSGLAGLFATGDVQLNMNSAGTNTFSLQNSSGNANLSVQNNLIIEGTSDLQGAISNSFGDLTVADFTDFQLSVYNSTGDFTIGDSAVVSGSLNLPGNVFDSSGAITLNDDTEIFGELVVAGTSIFRGAMSNDSGSITINDNLVVTGTSDLQSAISNSTANNYGAVYINDADGLYINQGTITQATPDQVTFAGNIDALLGLDLTGNLVVTGTSDLQGSIENSTANNGGYVAINDGIGVVGASYFNNLLQAQGGLEVSNADFKMVGAGPDLFTIDDATGNTFVLGTLDVTGVTTLTGALLANDNAFLGDDSGDVIVIGGGISDHVSINDGQWSVTDTGNISTTGTLEAYNNTDLGNGDDTLTLGVSTGAGTGDAVAIDGEVNIGQDANDNNINIGEAGDTVTLAGNVSIAQIQGGVVFTGLIDAQGGITNTTGDLAINKNLALADTFGIILDNTTGTSIITTSAGNLTLNSASSAVTVLNKLEIAGGFDTISALPMNIGPTNATSINVTPIIYADGGISTTSGNLVLDANGASWIQANSVLNMGLNNITNAGTITGTSLTDGTATLNGGTLSGIAGLSSTGNVTFNLLDAAADTTFTIANSDGSFEADLQVEGIISSGAGMGTTGVADFSGASSTKITYAASDTCAAASDDGKVYVDSNDNCGGAVAGGGFCVCDFTHNAGWTTIASW